MIKVSSKSAGLVGASRMTTCQVVSAGWQPASRVRQDAGLPIACARRSLYRKRLVEDYAPYISSDASSASQRDFHPIISDAHVHTALCRDGAQAGENFPLVASDDFRAAMSDNGARHALFLAPRELCPNGRVTD